MVAERGCDCEHPEKRPDSGKCGKKQIEECHGDAKKHPCTDREED